MRTKPLVKVPERLGSSELRRGADLEEVPSLWSPNMELPAANDEYSPTFEPFLRFLIEATPSRVGAPEVEGPLRPNRSAFARIS